MKHQPKKRKLRVAEGPYTVTFFIDGKAATKEEVIEHIKNQFIERTKEETTNFRTTENCRSH